MAPPFPPSCCHAHPVRGGQWSRSHRHGAGGARPLKAAREMREHGAHAVARSADRCSGFSLRFVCLVGWRDWGWRFASGDPCLPCVASPFPFHAGSTACHHATRDDASGDCDSSSGWGTATPALRAAKGRLTSSSNTKKKDRPAACMMRKLKCHVDAGADGGRRPGNATN